MRETVKERVRGGKLIAIVRGMDPGKILPLSEALHKGGISMIEVTFNQSDPAGFERTAEAIAAIRREFGEAVLAGAGTVITTEQVRLAAEAGALYMISPNVDVDVIRKTRELGLVSMPGAFTPSECMTAHNAGADFIKLFPAGNLGPGYLKALRAPLSHLEFLGVGGIGEGNMREFLDAGAVGFGVGGNLVNKALVEAGEWEEITALAKRYVQAVQLKGERL